MQPGGRYKCSPESHANSAQRAMQIQPRGHYKFSPEGDTYHAGGVSHRIRGRLKKKPGGRHMKGTYVSPSGLCFYEIYYR